MEWLEATGRAAHTDVLVISDHGHSTVVDTVDIGPWIRETVGEDSVVSAENGGSVLFYVRRRDRAVADSLAASLMTQPWCGPVLASRAIGPIEGTLPAGLAGADGERAPDLIASFAWTAGFSYCTGAWAGQGVHGSMSRQEVRNVLIARGPAFRSGIKLRAPTGNVDLAPTILELMGVAPPPLMQGRPLREALVATSDPSDVDWETRTHEAQRQAGRGTYRQRIVVSSAGGTTYVDDGSAELRL